ncbi:nucleoporin Nup43-like isoform X2 [Ostrea edulis]|uniref:nucleoporin Nup43-like isoform X2 n=1 Tax=Ostrea edulis TaxID=37623 RepID=UPI0024AFA882|nr:nucleoporin Nup43-like isoform X2 [Ostrea edulis]
MCKSYETKMAECIHPFVKFVSRKVNKIRWQQSQKQALECADTFVTGSWDDEDNKICLWYLGTQRSPQYDEGGGLEPTLKCEMTHSGDVTGLEFIEPDVIVASSSTGSVTMYKHHTASQTLGIQYKWQSLHRHGNHSCPCTCLAVRDKTIVTSGEDGRLVILNAEQKSPHRIIENADSSTINNIVFLKHTEVITVNSSGQLKTFDLRSNSDAPSQTLSVSGELTSLHCVDKHPGQPHIVATGSHDGVLGIWDLRQEASPVSLLEAHNGPMWEVKFHKTNSNHLFTCSEDGAVWHWDASLVGSSHMVQTQFTGAGSGGANFSLNPSFQFGGSENVNKWLCSDNKKMEINSLIDDNILPVNSVDIESQTLICGTDSESLITIRLPTLR